MTVLFVGFNPGLRSGETGHHYAGRNNRFWQLLHDAGLLPARLDPAEDRLVLPHGYGLTNIVTRTTASSSDLRRADYVAGAAELRRKVAMAKPQIICYMGKGVYAELSGLPSPVVPYGRQSRAAFPGVVDFVAHSPSGRATVPYSDKLANLSRLTELVREVQSTMTAGLSQALARNLLLDRLRLRPGDGVAVVTDRPASDPVRAALLLYGQAWGIRVETGDPAGPGPDVRPGVPVVVIPPATGASGTCAPHRVVLPDWPARSLLRMLSLPEALLAERRVALSDRLRSQPGLRIISAAGTDLRVQVAEEAEHWAAATDDEELRMSGLVTVPVVRARARGSVVLDGGLSWGYTSEVVRLEFVDGCVAGVARGGRSAGVKARPDPLIDSLLARLGTQSEPAELVEVSWGVNPAAAVSSCYDETSSVAGYCRLELRVPEAAGHRSTPRSAAATAPLSGIAAMCRLSEPV